MHQPIEPAIHYWGTPVVLLSTIDARGRPNVAPMSSVFWLGWTAMLGLDASSQTTANLIATRQCVLHLADEALAGAVDRLALTSQSAPLPLHKRLLGYRSVEDKIAHAGLTATAATKVRPPRLSEAKVQLEAVVERVTPMAQADARMAVPAVAVEVRIVAAHAEESILAGRSRIDPLRWRPLIMSFRRLFALGQEAGPSRLARGPEDDYAPWRGPPLRAAAGVALRALAHHRHGVREDEREEG